MNSWPNDLADNYTCEKLVRLASPLPHRHGDAELDVFQLLFVHAEVVTQFVYDC